MKTYTKECKWGNFLLLRGDMVSQYADVYGEWSELEVSLFGRTLSDSDNVVEVGANLGLHTVPLSKFVRHGKVVCFEPQRIIFQILCANCALNNRTNIHAYNTAVGDSPGTSDIPCSSYEKPWNYGAYSIKSGFDTEAEFNDDTWLEPVSIVRLDDHPDIVSLTSLKLLKIDAEGMEPAVLDGAADTIKRLRPVIFTENNNELTGDKLISRLRTLGYDCYWFCSERFSPSNYNKIRWKLPGGDYNMICYPQELKIAPASLIKVSAFDDLKLRKVGWVTGVENFPI